MSSYQQQQQDPRQDQQRQKKQDEEARLASAVLAKQTADNVSRLLDTLLHDYDKTLRPGVEGILHVCLFRIISSCSAGPAVLVEGNMQVRSMGPISEIDMVQYIVVYDNRLLIIIYRVTPWIATSDNLGWTIGWHMLDTR